MILAEPPSSQGDVHFRIFGIPVRIHPFFWLVTLIITLQGKSPPGVVLSWMVAVVISILVHELGHAFLQIRYGGHPRIVLHGFGGLAICGDCDRSSKAQLLISLAGPMAGFLFALVVLMLVRLAGHQVGVEFADQPSSAALLSFSQPPDGQKVLGTWFYWEQFSSPHVNRFIKDLLWINILWGVINLLPIYPLDGGQISRELCVMGLPARRGIELSLQISIVAAIAMALVGLSWNSLFTVFMFGYLAYSSYQGLQSYRTSLW